MVTNSAGKHSKIKFTAGHESGLRLSRYLLWCVYHSGWQLVTRICFPKRKSGNDLCYHYRFFVCSQRESNPQLVLRRHLLYPFNYENKCRIYGLFSHFGYGFHFFQFILLNDDFSFLFTLTFSAVQLESNSDLSPFCFYRV